jgi:hypothetical protein
MPNDAATRVARIDKAEWSGMPLHWTRQERGRFLRQLLRQKGVDPDRLYKVEYHPRHACWLLVQEAGPEEPSIPTTAAPPSPADELFYLRAADEFRRTALLALGSRPGPFANLRGKYELPDKGEEISPADLAHVLGGRPATDPPVRFDAEGRWRAGLPQDGPGAS